MDSGIRNEISVPSVVLFGDLAISQGPELADATFPAHDENELLTALEEKRVAGVVFSGPGLVHAAKRLREHPAGRDVALYFLSDTADEATRAAAIELGALDFVSPSDSLSFLRNQLRVLCRRKDEFDALESLRRIGGILAAELDLKKLVQALTDESTRLVGAQFGSFFYNDPHGLEVYELYTLSGVPREHFAGFPMPRATALFGPTFRGEGIIRSDDILKDPRYGLSAPYHGMPKGHLPVRSYLAAPVISRSGKVWGGLFFGHAKPGVFPPRTAHLLQAVASQAAVALDNARLYQQAQQALDRQERSLRDLERSNAELQQFAHITSHDLKEPLRTVSTFAQLFRKRFGEQLGREGDEWTGYMIDGAKRMYALLDDLLLMSRAGHAQTPSGMFGMDEACQAALANLRVAIDEAGAQVTVGEMPSVYGDRARIVQVLQNLIGNAVKFRGEGRCEVRVEAQREGDAWRFSVIDNGIGIAPEFFEKIFVLFQRLHHRHEYPGTGVGLAICRKIIEQHGGRIWVEGTPGGGTTFHFTLPAEPL